MKNSPYFLNAWYRSEQIICVHVSSIKLSLIIFYQNILILNTKNISNEEVRLSEINVYIYY